MREEEKTPSGEKPRYEAPVLVELGAIARGVGAANCSFGTSPGGPCLSGPGPSGACTIGFSR